MTHLCNVPGCSSEVIARGLCSTHYKHWQRHGTINDIKPDWWFSKAGHPLEYIYDWICRTQKPISEDWKVFQIFAKDVGTKVENAYFKRIDESLPFSKTNFKWVTKIPNEERATYMRAWTEANKEKVKNTNIKRMYGITLEQYHTMLDKQKNTCAICGKEESMIVNGKVFALAVDHCHTTGKVRGLLCRSCNKALGLLNDDVELMKKAIHYLEK